MNQFWSIATGVAKIEQNALVGEPAKSKSGRSNVVGVACKQLRYQQFHEIGSSITPTYINRTL